MKKRKRSKSSSNVAKKKRRVDNNSSSSDNETSTITSSAANINTSKTNVFEVKADNPKPQVDQRVEICDQDNIWSSARIVKVDKNQKNITITYDGWGSEWDETVHYVNNPRLATFGTYTKRLKCLVELFPRGKNTTSAVSSATATATSTRVMTMNKKQSILWPCIVNIRAPSPVISLSEYQTAEEFLESEPNVFIQPYGIKHNFLPKQFSAKAIDNGRWIKAARIRKWAYDTECIEGTFPSNFEIAHLMAKEDENVQGYLDFNAFAKGSLIHYKHRQTPEGYVAAVVEGDSTDGDKKIKKGKKSKKDVDETSSLSSTEPAEWTDDNKDELDHIDNEIVYEPPPVLPQPAKVNVSIYPNSNIIQSTKTGRWIASFLKNGNDVYLGSFVTQTEAHNAIVAATAKDESTVVSSSSSSSSPTIPIPPPPPQQQEKTPIDTSSITSSSLKATQEATIASIPPPQQENALPPKDLKIEVTNELNTRSELQPQSATTIESFRVLDMKALQFSTVITLGSQQPQEDFSIHEWTMQNTKHKGYEYVKHDRYRIRFEELKKERALKRMKERKKKRCKIIPSRKNQRE